ncbi:hypothetical protein ACFVH7_39915 [Kitasatospora indigofera]|uniref:hypothetical protein n=1 Tax=Kitasatospora indigofera TaxID=67307 RepID=UPI0036359FCA
MEELLADGTVPKELLDAVGRWIGMKPCGWCGKSIPAGVGRRGGRPKLTCSDKCRTARNRAIRSGMDVDSGCYPP